MCLMYPLQNGHGSVSDTRSDRETGSINSVWSSCAACSLAALLVHVLVLLYSLVYLRESRFQGICACPAAPRTFFTPAPSLFISAGILIRALWASAGEVRRKLCFLTANKNLIISLIQEAHRKKKILTSAITQTASLPFSLMLFFI